MKKLLVLLLVLVLALTGCASNAETDNEAGNVTNTPNDTVQVEPEEEESDGASQLAVNKRIPNFEFTTLSGETVRMHDYDGKIIMLNFWATWCPYCIEEMPDLEEMNAEEDVVVLALNAREPKDVVADYIEEHPYDFEILLDEDGTYSNMFYVSSLPTTFFINEEGILLGSMPGMLTKEQMEMIIQDIRDDEL